MKKFNHLPNEKLINSSKFTSDKDYMSVTSLTSKMSEDAILDWRKRVGEEEANRIMKESSQKGIAIHSFCEDYINNEPILIPEKDIEEYYTFKAMKSELNNIDNVWGLEIPLWSDEYKLKGRCDCIAEFNGSLAMIDFKTTKKPKKREWITSYFIQATAYTEMVKEQTDIQIDDIVLIFGVLNYNQVKVETAKSKDYIKELNKINNNFNFK
tara:strand:+ start:17233 stop:17865 length:633 start_codon:yes stop_codon:yes gene_type:complete